jgi:hypothetical protein
MSYLRHIVTVQPVREVSMLFYINPDHFCITLKGRHAAVIWTKSNLFTQNFSKRPTNVPGFMNVGLLHSTIDMFRPFMWPSSRHFLLGFDFICSDLPFTKEQCVLPNNNDNNNNYYYHHRHRRHLYHFHRHRSHRSIRRYALRICVGQMTILTLFVLVFLSQVRWYSKMKPGIPASKLLK